METREKYATSIFDKLQDRVIRGVNIVDLEHKKSGYNGITTALFKITSSTISKEDFFKEIDTFNDSHMNAKEGVYSTIDFRGDHGDITVKYYENGSISISASWED